MTANGGRHVLSASYFGWSAPFPARAGTRRISSGKCRCAAPWYPHTGEGSSAPLRRLANETRTHETRHGWSAVEGRLGVCSPQSRGGLTAQNETPEPGAAGFTPNLETTVAVRYLSESMHTGAHCGASSMTSSAQPALVVFDLDACCWYPEMYQLWVRGQIANPGLRTHVHGSR